MTLLSTKVLTPLRRMDMRISRTRFGGLVYQLVRLPLLSFYFPALSLVEPVWHLLLMAWNTWR